MLIPFQWNLTTGSTDFVTSPLRPLSTSWKAHSKCVHVDKPPKATLRARRQRRTEIGYSPKDEHALHRPSAIAPNIPPAQAGNCYFAVSHCGQLAIPRSRLAAGAKQRLSVLSHTAHNSNARTSFWYASLCFQEMPESHQRMNSPERPLMQGIVGVGLDSQIFPADDAY